MSFCVDSIVQDLQLKIKPIIILCYWSIFEILIKQKNYTYYQKLNFFFNLKALKKIKHNRLIDFKRIHDYSLGRSDSISK